MLKSLFQEDGWAPDRFRTFWRGEISFAPLAIRTADRRIRRLVAISTTPSRLLYVICWMMSRKGFKIMRFWPKQDISRTYLWTD